MGTQETATTKTRAYRPPRREEHELSGLLDENGKVPDQGCVNLIVNCLLAGDAESAELWLDIMAREYKNTSNKAFYHSLIHSCAKAGNPNAAGWCAVRMVRAGLQPNKITFNSVIDACAKAGDIALASKWWKQMTQVGLVPNGITYNTMINACAQARDAPQAEWWMQQMLNSGILPCIVSFSTVIDAFAKTGKIDKAELWFSKMKSAGVVADGVIYNSLINACAKAGNPSKAEYWLLQMHVNNLAADEKTYNSLISASAKAGAIDRAEHWFRRMEETGCKADKITFGSVIHASAKCGKVDRAEYWIDQMMERGLMPNLVCFNTVLHACAHSGDYRRASKWFMKTLSAGITPNKITYNSMIDAYAKANDMATAELWLVEMVMKGFHPDEITYVTLQRACMHRCNDVNSDEIAQWTYSTIVRAYIKVGNIQGVHRWLTDMWQAGFRPQPELCEDVLALCRGGKPKNLAAELSNMVKMALGSSNNNAAETRGKNPQHQKNNGKMGVPGGAPAVAALHAGAPDSQNGMMRGHGEQPGHSEQPGPIPMIPGLLMTDDVGKAGQRMGATSGSAGDMKPANNKSSRGRNKQVGWTQPGANGMPCPASGGAGLAPPPHTKGPKQQQHWDMSNGAGPAGGPPSAAPPCRGGPSEDGMDHWRPQGLGGAAPTPPPQPHVKGLKQVGLQNPGRVNGMPGKAGIPGMPYNGFDAQEQMGNAAGGGILRANSTPYNGGEGHRSMTVQQAANMQRGASWAGMPADLVMPEGTGPEVHHFNA